MASSGEAKQTFSVLFVCLGNICRSPMAGAVFKEVVRRKGLQSSFARIESAGTAGYHIGEEPDERTVATCRKHNVPIDSLAQQVKAEDFRTYDYILGMDVNNVRNLHSMKPKGSKAQVVLFGEFGDGKPINDPYYGSAGGFDTCYRQCVQYSLGFLKHLGFDVNPLESL